MSATTTQSSTEAKQKTEEFVKNSFTNALQMMTKAGYNFPDNVRVTVDTKLPFMGYTMPTHEGFNIVVSGGAVSSGMLEDLLIHEMSHIYRITTNHPSHDGAVLGEAVDKITKTRRLRDYQQKIIHDLLNDIQDLYADDILFKVLRGSPVMSPEEMTSFLQSWVKESPVKSRDPVADRWTNTSIMAHNARAIAQMERHRVEDTDGRAAKSNRQFLEQVSPAIANQFEYFRNTLANLREGMTRDQYRALLAKHLDRFLQAVRS